MPAPENTAGRRTARQPTARRVTVLPARTRSSVRSGSQPFGRARSPADPYTASGYEETTTRAVRPVSRASTM